ncbi:MAG: hypothetical protein INQ03_09130 [Candidatus Heimdallarchaeota archaeon]|nr:hypothetical protein [Candidatus Heimdallarchaeota archaeon]
MYTLTLEERIQQLLEYEQLDLVRFDDLQAEVEINLRKLLTPEVMEILEYLTLQQGVLHAEIIAARLPSLLTYFHISSMTAIVKEFDTSLLPTSLEQLSIKASYVIDQHIILPRLTSIHLDLPSIPQFVYLSNIREMCSTIAPDLRLLVLERLETAEIPNFIPHTLRELVYTGLASPPRWVFSASLQKLSFIHGLQLPLVWRSRIGQIIMAGEIITPLVPKLLSWGNISLFIVSLMVIIQETIL